MASTDARPTPQKNVAYRVTFPIFNATGDLVTGATGLDSEVSKDAGTFADCTNEATEIATSSGMYYLDLTSTEMNADTVAVIVKTSSSGAKTTPLVMYPEEAGDIRVNVTQWTGTNVATPATNGYPAVTLKVGTGTGEVNLSSGGVPIQAGTGTGQLDFTSGVVKSNMTQMGGVAQSATDLKDFADDGYDPATNKVQGVVLTDTVTIYTGNTPQTGDNFARIGAPVGASISADIAAVQADTDNIQTRIPAALVSGRMSSDVVAISGDTTAADNAEAFFDGTGYAGTNNVIPLVTVTTTATNLTTNNDKTGYGLADGAITAAKIADGALTAAKFASGAFDAVWTVTSRTLSSFGTLVADVATAVWAAGTRTLTAISDSSGVTTLLSRLTNTRATNLDNLDATVSSRLASGSYTAPPTAADNAAAVWSETGAEPASVPAASASLKDKISYLFMKARNKRDQSTTQQRLYADNGSTVVATRSVTDNGTIATIGEDA